MNKVLCTFLLLAILGIAQCESFKRISIDQGKISLNRNLDTKDSIHKAALESTPRTAANVTILEAFTKANELDLTKTPTKMQVFLTLPDSGFLQAGETKTTGYTYLTGMKCADPCKLSEMADSFQISHPFFSTNSQTRQIISTGPYVRIVDGGADAWTLKDKPIFMNILNPREKDLLVDGAHGVLGLGSEGTARQNFVGEFPLFSVKLNSAGSGELIFGEDKAQFDSGRKALTWNTTANWVGESSEMMKIAQKTIVHLDINQVETILPGDITTAIFNAYNMSVNSTAGAKYNYYYNVAGRAAILPNLPVSKLPPMTMKIGETEVTIPFEALFNKTEKAGMYDFVVSSANTMKSYNKTSSPRSDDSEDVRTIVFGRHFLSNFYSVFSSPTDKTAFVTLHPTYTSYGGSDSSSSGGSGKFLIGLIAVIGLGAVGFIVFRNKAASKLAEHLNEK